MKNLLSLALTVCVGLGGVAAFGDEVGRVEGPRDMNMFQVEPTVVGEPTYRAPGSNSKPPDPLRHMHRKWASERQQSEAEGSSAKHEHNPPPKGEQNQPTESAQDTANEKATIQTLELELKRNFDKLKNAGTAPLYFLAYRLYEQQNIKIGATSGALIDKPDERLTRTLSIDLRVGSPKLDNTHYLLSDHSRAPANWDQSKGKNSILPALGADIPLREAIWIRTDDAFKRAQSRFQSVLASKDVLAAEEDESGDFSPQPAQLFDSGIKSVPVNMKEWQEKVKRLSKLFNQSWIEDSEVSLNLYPSVRYIVDTEGSRIVEQSNYYMIYGSGSTLTDDGMKLSLCDYDLNDDPGKLPNEEKCVERFNKVINNLKALRNAPPAESFVGPAILSGRAAAVFFHETFGHRIESVHEKSEAEGKTFAKKIGTLVMPSFITVTDDPNATDVKGEFLNGHYRYDDEGVRAQAVDLAKNGILNGFLMSRTPLQGFEKSNGHGRGAPGWNPMARQANLFVSVDKDKQFSDQALRAMLIKEAKRQKKPYGLYFESISGGYTGTSSRSEQTYTITPLLVYKVFVDGRPDQMIRGAHLVGTPLAALEKIIAGGTELGVFNGSCGRESGYIRNSAVAPSMLLQSIEVKRSAKTFEKRPILPDPVAKPESSAKPDSSAKPESSAKPDSVAKPDAATKPESATKPDSVAKPDASAKPDSGSAPAKSNTGAN